jgi:hypothetical protein
MTQLVMDRHKIARVDLGAHLDPQIILVIEVPRAGMADNFAVGGLGDL